MNKFRIMLLLLGLALLTIAPQVARAQAQPIGQIISYQGKLTNADGTPIANGTKSVTFKIYENGAAIFNQAATVSTLGGVFSTLLNVGGLTFNPAKIYELGITLNGSETRHSIAAVPVAKSAASVTGPGSIPVGGVIMWWSDGTLPDGWAVCDGSTVSATASPINGKALPDLRDKFVRGVGNADVRSTPVSGGSDHDTHTHLTGDHVLTIAEMPSHSHPSYIANSNGYGGTDGAPAGSGFDGAYHGSTPTIAVGGNQSHNHGPTGPPSTVANPENNVPAYVGLVYIMRIY